MRHGGTIQTAPTLPEAPPAASLGEVLHREEVARARVFFPTTMALAAANLACVPILPYPPETRPAAAIVLAAALALSAAGTYISRDPARYTAGRAAALGAACGVVATAILYFIGIFCAGAMILVLGIHFFAGGSSRAAAVLVYLGVALSYLVVSAGVASGLLADVALFHVRDVPEAVQWFQVGMSQFFFALTLYMALRNRAALEGAVLQATRASMQIRQQSAQLAEARRELDQALLAGEGRRSGDVLGGYRLGELLGRGGMGEVYRAEDVVTGRHTAVKVMHMSLLDDEEQVRRFLREAELAASVRSPHVVEVIDMGRAPDGSPFLVMELLDGHDLAWHLRRHGRLPLNDVVELIDQLTVALTAMRDAGIVHRDLKPGNLVLTRRASPDAPIWKVLDFGIGKALGKTSTLTQGSQILGTPSYMAPEQIGGQVDHRTDLYAVAALTYRALTGSVPFDGDEAAQIVYKVVFSQPPAPSQFAQLPSDVELVLALGLAKKPGDRFDRIEDLARAMRLAAKGELDEVTRARGWKHLKTSPWSADSDAPPDSARVA